MTNTTVTDRVRDINKILDFLEDFRENCHESLLPDTYDKADWEDKLTFILTSAYISHVVANIEDMDMKVVSKCILDDNIVGLCCHIYYMLSKFDQQLELDEIDLAADYIAPVFMSIMRLSHDHLGIEMTDDYEDKLADFFALTPITIKTNGKSN